MRPARVYLASSRSGTGCNDYNCAEWGASKLVDAGPPDLSSLALANSGPNPFWQLDLGRPRAGIAAVALLPGPWDWNPEAFQDLSITLSNTTLPDAPGVVLCAAGVRFKQPGVRVTVGCPVKAVARYVNIIKAGVSNLPLYEAVPLELDDGVCGAKHACNPESVIDAHLHALLHVTVCVGRCAGYQFAGAAYAHSACFTCCSVVCLPGCQHGT